MRLETLPLPRAEQTGPSRTNWPVPRKLARAEQTGPYRRNWKELPLKALTQWAKQSILNHLQEAVLGSILIGS